MPTRRGGGVVGAATRRPADGQVAEARRAKRAPRASDGRRHRRRRRAGAGGGADDGKERRLAAARGEGPAAQGPAAPPPKWVSQPPKRAPLVAFVGQLHSTTKERIEQFFRSQGVEEGLENCDC